jgi:hypothetical protein
MARISKGHQLANQYIGELRTENSLLTEALSGVALNEHKYVNSFTLDGTRVSAYLIHPERAHGGIVMFKHHTGQGRPTFDVRYLERYTAEMQHAIGSSDYVREMLTLLEKCNRLAHHKEN